MFGLGHTELLIILLLVVVFFGAKRLPEIGKALGRIGSEYKSGRESVNAASKNEEAGKETSESGSPDSGSQSSESQNGGMDIEAEIKNHLISRMPGIGRINKLKRTAEMVGKVARAAEKSGDSNTGPDKKA